MLSFLFLTTLVFAQSPEPIAFGEMRIGSGVQNKNHARSIILFCVEKQQPGGICTKTQFGIAGHIGSLKKDIFGNNRRLEGLKELGPVLDLQEDATIYSQLDLSEKKFVYYFTGTKTNWQHKPYPISKSKFEHIKDTLLKLQETKQKQLQQKIEQERMAQLAPFVFIKATDSDMKYSCTNVPCFQGDVVFRADSKKPFYVLSVDKENLNVFDGETIIQGQDRGLFTISLSQTHYQSEYELFSKTYWVLSGRTHLYSELIGRFRILKIYEQKKSGMQDLILADIRLEQPLKPKVKEALSSVVSLQQPDELLMKGISLRLVLGLKNIFINECGSWGTVEERIKDCTAARDYKYVNGYKSPNKIQLKYRDFELVTAQSGYEIWQDTETKILWFNQIYSNVQDYDYRKFCEKLKIPFDSFRDVRFSLPSVKEIDDEVLYGTTVGRPFVRKNGQSYADGFLVSDGYQDFIVNEGESKKEHPSVFFERHYANSYGYRTSARNAICKAQIH